MNTNNTRTEISMPTRFVIMLGILLITWIIATSEWFKIPSFNEWPPSVAIILGCILGLPFLVYGLGLTGIYWCIIKEGTGIVIERNGEYVQAKIRSKGFWIREDQEILQEKEGDGHPPEPWWRKFTGGLVWIGFFPFEQVMQYWFRYITTVIKTDKEGKAIKVEESREQLLNYFFVKAAQYEGKLIKVPDEDMFQMDVFISYFVRITNPKKALTRIHQWFEFMVTTLDPHIREYCRAKSYENITKVDQSKSGGLYKFLEHARLTPKQKEALKAEMAEEGKTNQEIKDLEEKSWGVLMILKERYGITVDAVKLPDINLNDPKLNDAIAIEKRSELEAKGIHNINEAMRKYGGQASLVKYVEGMVEASKGEGSSTFWLGLESLVKDVGSALSSIAPTKDDQKKKKSKTTDRKRV